MKLKQTNILKLAALVVLFACIGSFFGVSPASAYTCEYSGPNKDGKDGDGKKLEYSDGSCIVWKQDDKDNGKRRPILDASGKQTGYQCTGGTVLVGGDCYSLRREYTSIKPTYDDGSEVSSEVWYAVCSATPDYYGTGSHYVSERHACEARSNCFGYDADSTTGGCRKIGDHTATPDSVAKDPTTARAQRKKQCITGKGSWDAGGNNGQGVCNDTAESCALREGEWKANKCSETAASCKKKGYGWDDKKKDCDKNTKVDPNSTTVSGYGANNTQSTGKCGSNTKVRTALITANTAKEACNGKGVSLIGNLLKYVLNILSIGVGVVAVGGVVYGSLLYTSARDNSGQTQQAITIIRNVVVGVLLYVFMVSILNWLVPGGVIG